MATWAVIYSEYPDEGWWPIEAATFEEATALAAEEFGEDASLSVTLATDDMLARLNTENGDGSR